MMVYVKYIATWLFFMVLIAGITLIVPKVAKKIDKWRAEKKAQTKMGTDTFLKPITPEETGSTPEPDEKTE